MSSGISSYALTSASWSSFARSTSTTSLVSPGKPGISSGVMDMNLSPMSFRMPSMIAFARSLSRVNANAACLPLACIEHPCRLHQS